MITSKRALPLILTTVSLAACEIGFKPIGGEDETTGSEAGDGDGDPGDGDPGDGDPGDGDPGDGDPGDGDPGDGDPGDGDPGDGDPGDGDPGDGDGDGECPPPPQSPFEVEFDYQLTITEDPNIDLPIDQSCTILSISSGTNASIDIDCPGTTGIELDFTVMPGLELPGQAGDTVHVWLHHAGDEWNPTWLRLDFPEHNGSLFVIDAEPLAPPSGYFPPPWGLAIADSCGPIDDGCATTRPEQLQISFLGQTLSAWADDYASLDLSEARVEMWVAHAHEIVELSPVCDPTAEFFLTHRVLINSTGSPVEGEVCDPGESNPCGTGLHCCYPCGIPDCDYVCTPEDPDTMQCPLPPP